MKYNIINYLDFKYMIHDIIHNIEVFFHDLLFPWNKLHIKTLKRGWADRDTVLLHANFQVLTDFIENEMFSEHHYPLLDIEKETKWMYDAGCSEEDIKQTVINIKKANDDTIKLMKLYKWWHVERKERDNNYPEYKKNDFNWGLEYNKYEKMCDDEDTEKLIELIKLRKYMWS